MQWRSGIRDTNKSLNKEFLFEFSPNLNFRKMGKLKNF